MKLIYMGTPDFAVDSLEAIIEAGHEVAAVVTQPDKQKGRGREVQMTPVKECALKHGIPVLQPAKIREPEVVKELQKYSADLFVVAAFGQLLTEEILKMPKFGCVNIHASLLPSYRGAAPIQWVIINGEEKTGITIMQMAKGLDTGDMLMKKEIVIDQKETGESLHNKLRKTAAELIVEALPQIEAKALKAKKQDESLVCLAPRLTKSMGLIDWSKDAVSIERLIRGLNSWPSAYTMYHGRTLKIWEADVVLSEEADEPGRVISKSKEFFDVAAGRDIIRIRSLQLEGKKKVSAKDFLLGYEINCGMKFPS